MATKRKTNSVMPACTIETTERSLWLSDLSEAICVEMEPCADILDQANELAQLYNESVLEALRRERINQAIHAHERIQQGLAGICEDCGRQIGPERLSWLPNATRCMPCQSKHEKRRNIF